VAPCCEADQCWLTGFMQGLDRGICAEDAFWNGLKEIARERHMNLSELVAESDAKRQHGNLSSALRLFVLDFYRGQLSRAKEGHNRTHEMTAIRRVPILNATDPQNRATTTILIVFGVGEDPVKIGPCVRLGLEVTVCSHSPTRFDISCRGREMLAPCRCATSRRAISGRE
jgi:predicted DNA-binding ribbon-helix-helix protein